MTDQLSADERDDPVAGGHTDDSVAGTTSDAEPDAGSSSDGEPSSRVVMVDDDPTPPIGVPQPPEAKDSGTAIAPGPTPPAAATADATVLHVAATPDASQPPRKGRFRRRRRVSKWDRPPDPRDWRFFVGGLGKILITTGLLLFGFVAYQLWGTGIETARAQNALENDFEAALAATEFEVAPPDAIDEAATESAAADEQTDTPAAAPDADTAGDEPVAPDADTADGAADDDIGESAAEPVEPPPPTDPDDLSEVAIEQNVPIIERGEAIGRLEMPTIDKSVFVVPGVEVDDLKDGPGHYPDTPLPGQLGNSAIAGHRTTYGEPFIDLDDLEVGDEIIVTTLYGRFVYEVTGSQVVGPSDSWVVQTTDWDVATLTLTTCHPKWTARERLIVSAALDPERSTSVGEPTFYELGAEAGGAIPGDDPTIDTTIPGDDQAPLDADGTADVDPTAPAPESAAADDAVEEAEASAIDDASADAEEVDASAAPEEPSDPEVAAPPVAVSDLPDIETASGEQPTPEDAFSRGWFDDDEAFPQIALWGSALAAIALLAYALSRKVRHDSVGFLFGFAPFVVALYFFFQNVHRLLPPGI